MRNLVPTINRKTQFVFGSYTYYGDGKNTFERLAEIKRFMTNLFTNYKRTILTHYEMGESDLTVTITVMCNRTGKPIFSRQFAFIVDYSVNNLPFIRKVVCRILKGIRKPLRKKV